MTDYFYPGTKIDSFMQFPRFFINIEPYCNVSNNGKILYIYFVEYTFAAKNRGYMTEDGKIYVRFTIARMSEMIGCSQSVVKNCLNELEKIGLIKRERVGRGLPNKIFIKIPILKEGYWKDRNEINEEETSTRKTENNFLNDKKGNNELSSRNKNNYQERQNKTSNINRQNINNNTTKSVNKYDNYEVDEDECI